MKKEQKNEVAQLVIAAKVSGKNLSEKLEMDGNIIIPQTAEEQWYYVNYKGVWYSVKWEWDEFCDGEYDNCEIEENVFAQEYYEEFY